MQSSISKCAYLGVEAGGSLGRVVLAVSCDVSTTDFLDGHVLDVEADVVAGDSLGQRLVVHLHRLDLSGQVGGSEGDDHAGLQETSLNTADGYSSDTCGKIMHLGTKSRTVCAT